MQHVVVYRRVRLQVSQYSSSRAVVLNQGAAEPLGTVKGSRGVANYEIDVYLLVSCN